MPLLIQLPECNVCGLWVSAGQMPKTKLHFLTSCLGAEVSWLYSHFCATAFSPIYHSHACCPTGDSPVDCSQGPVYSIFRLCPCFTLQNLLCSTSPCALSFYSWTALWRNASRAKGHHKKRDLLKKTSTTLIQKQPS